MRRDVAQEITDRIVAALERGVVPWRKPFKTMGGRPVNIKTGRQYRGVNVLLLSLEEYDDPRWGTFDAMKNAAADEARRQGREIVVEITPGGKRYWEIIDGERVWFTGGVRKGQKGTQIVLWKPVPAKKNSAGETERDGYFFLTYYNVFNATQVQGVPELEKYEREFTPIEQAEQIVGNYIFEPGSGNDGPPVYYGSNSAFYVPSKDEVRMPDPEAFESDQAFYCTLFHELIHSTGHESRLRRIEPALFGSDPYAREELVAEIGASFLAGAAEFDDAGGDQSAAYVGHWLERIRDDKKFVTTAAAQAQKAADRILGVTFDEKKPVEEQELAGVAS